MVACWSLLITLSAFAPAGPLPAADEAVVKRLVEALKDSDLEVRMHLGAALSKCGAAAVEPLAAALKSASADQRAGAAYALGLIGSAARPALPTLLDALSDPELEVRRQTAMAINRVYVPSRPAPATPLAQRPPTTPRGAPR